MPSPTAARLNASDAAAFSGSFSCDAPGSFEYPMS
jgi:hypothetical protein